MRQGANPYSLIHDGGPAVSQPRCRAFRKKCRQGTPGMASSGPHPLAAGTRCRADLRLHGEAPRSLQGGTARWVVL